MDEPLIAIVGAGPAGLACALGLAAFDVGCVLLDDGYEISEGSRATGISRRALQLLAPSGVADEVMEIAVVQVANQAFAGTAELFLDRTPPEPPRFPRVVNIPQDRLEQMIVGAIAKRPSIELRRGHRVTDVRQDGDGVHLEADAGGATVSLRADWLLACDGGRSSIRRALGATLEGVRHDARFIVTDVRADLDVPAGVRRIWFDPPSNPQGTVIVHQQPGGLWRLDFGVPPDADMEVELDRASVEARVAAHLELLGAHEPWELVWIGSYAATSVGLRSYRHGRVLFAGDAAHLIPIFGGRGMNSAFEDGFNAAWKLAAVARGGPEWLLDSYSIERVGGADQNMAKAGIGVEVSAARSPGSLLLRRSLLGLILEGRPVESLLDHRTSDANSYAGSPLLQPQQGGEDRVAGRPGEALFDMPAALADGSSGFLLDALGEGFTLLEITDERNGGAVVASADELPPTLFGLPLHHVRLHAPAGSELSAYAPGAYLVRPDRYVMARGVPGSGADLVAAAGELFHAASPR
jgi:3-(3-hydroxy-phenyl)propionate hydroxylase